MKKIILTVLIMFAALSAFAQMSAPAYIFDESGTPTNVRNAPKGKVVQKLPYIGGGYVVMLLEVKNGWWRIDPDVELCGDVQEEEMKLKGSTTGYWLHNSVLAFGINGDPKNVLRQSPNGKPIKIPSAHLWDGLRPLEIQGKWIKVTTFNKHYTGWMPISRICANPLTTCP